VNAYSYVRWSSGKQTDGDSLKRQTETARRICLDKGWNLIDLPPDAGISAYKGKNLSHKGILGQFINKVEKAEISTPCVLVLEKLDRFSRAEVDEVLPLFIQLIKSGVNVYSVIENNYYTKEELRANPITQIIGMLMGFVGANSYSKGISERSKAALQRQIKEVLAGNSKYLHSSCPYYLDYDAKTKTYFPNDKQKIVQRIFKEILNGKPLQTLAKELNIEGVPTLSGISKGWRQTTIRQLLQNKATIGIYKTKKIFPSTVSDEDFNRVQGLIERRKIGKGKTSDFINIFRTKLKCSKCGNWLSLQSTRQKYFYYRCVGHKTGLCNSKGFVRVSDVEQFIFGLLLETTPEELLTQDNAKHQQAYKDYQTQIIGITKQIERLLTLEDLGIEEIKAQLIILKDKRSEIEKLASISQSKLGEAPILSINSLKELSKREDCEAYEGMTKHFNKLILDLEQPEIRNQLREIIHGIIHHVEIDLDAVLMRLQYINGVQTPWQQFIF
jgi:DNA invertase Pin-like site-specific DNA recombinase